MTEIEEGGGERAEIAKRDEAARQTTIAKLAAALKRTDEQPRLLQAAKLARELLRGDSRRRQADRAHDLGGRSRRQLLGQALAGLLPLLR